MFMLCPAITQMNPIYQTEKYTRKPGTTKQPKVNEQLKIVKNFVSMQDFLGYY